MPTGSKPCSASCSLSKLTSEGERLMNRHPLVARCVSFVNTHRLLCLEIVCALLVLFLAPHPDTAFAIVFAGRTVQQLETELREKQTKAKTLLETTMRACAETVVKPATATEPEVKGRLMMRCRARRTCRRRLTA
jgi:hypothetical protein